jgi:hypothetical protein
MGNLDLYYAHMSTEGSLTFNCNECHAYSMRGMTYPSCFLARDLGGALAILPSSTISKQGSDNEGTESEAGNPGLD